MKLSKIFLCTAVIIFLISCGTSRAEISKVTVSKAWNRITKADGFKQIPINYEKDSEPNAWVEFADGENFTVHVTKGLMKILSTEDEIAGVLGHELGHVRLGHYSGTGVNYSVRTFIGINSGMTHEGVEFQESSFSRQQETEADDYGTKLLRKARYSPRGLYDALRRFEAHGYGTQRNGFNSHPASEERMTRLAEKAGINPGLTGSSVMGMEDIADILLGR